MFLLERVDRGWLARLASRERVAVDPSPRAYAVGEPPHLSRKTAGNSPDRAIRGEGYKQQIDCGSEAACTSWRGELLDVLMCNDYEL
jgi:hypothetical protein